MQILQFLGQGRQVLFDKLPYVDAEQFIQEIDFQSKNYVELHKV